MRSTAIFGLLGILLVYGFIGSSLRLPSSGNVALSSSPFSNVSPVPIGIPQVIERAVTIRTSPFSSPTRQRSIIAVSEGDEEEVAPLNTFAPSMVLVATPSEVSVDENVVVTWTSVGMSDAEPCMLSLNDAPLEVGNGGTRSVRLTSSAAAGVITFSLHCVSAQTHRSTEASTSVTVRE